MSIEGKDLKFPAYVWEAVATYAPLEMTTRGGAPSVGRITYRSARSPSSPASVMRSNSARTSSSGGIGHTMSGRRVNDVSAASPPSDSADRYSLQDTTAASCSAP